MGLGYWAAIDYEAEMLYRKLKKAKEAKKVEVKHGNYFPG